MQRVGPVVTLQLVPLPSRAPFSLSPLDTSVESKVEEEERARRHPTRLPLISLASPFAARPLAHAMINITPQSYGIQTDLETDFFLLKASSVWGRRGAVQLPSRNFSSTRNRKPEREIKSRRSAGRLDHAGKSHPAKFPYLPRLPPRRKEPEWSR